VTLRMRIASGGTALALAAALGLMPAAVAASATPAGPTAAAAQTVAGSIPVTGTLPDGTVFTGQLTNLTSSVVGGVLQLSGTITGTGLPAGGTTFTAPIQDLQANGSCTILTLDLGPLHLDLLGLVIDLAPVHLDITAVPGPGNLLGNLLCAVAGLFDSPGTGGLNGVAALLNRLLTGLGL
jgi:hypothetical protein